MNTQRISLHRGELLFRYAGTALLTGGLVLGIVIVLWSAWKIPDVSPVIPVLLLAGVATWYAFQRPLLNLFVVLVSFYVIADFAAGFDIREILYGLYFLGFLGYWYFRRLFLYHENVFQRPEERILVLFLVLVTLTFPLTLIQNGSPTGFFSEWLSLAFLAFYFPIKEEIERNPRALPVILVAVFCVGFFVLARNVLKFQTIVSNAEYAYEIARGRAVTNETLLLLPAVTALTFAVFQRKWIPRLSFLALFGVFFGGVLLTQSRGYWIGFLFGAFVLFLMVPRHRKVTLILIGLTTLLGILAVGLIMIGESVFLLAYGVVERLLSILSATSLDISLINRILETKGVWHYVKDNPILGYGLGVNYRVYDIISEVTVTKAFIHNGYIALWYKFGIWGLGMVLYFFGSMIRRSHQTFRSPETPSAYQTAALAMLVSFSALFVSAMTSNPFYLNDTMFAYGIMAGIVGGCRSHLRNGTRAAGRRREG